MKRFLLLAAGVLLASLALARLGDGHGGEVPPPDPPPPGTDIGGGPDSGGGGLPGHGDPGPGPGPPKPPPDAPTPPRPKDPGAAKDPQKPGQTPQAPITPSGPSGPRTPGPGMAGKKNRPTASLDHWDVWWKFNKDPYLNLRSRVRAAAPQSGAAAFLTGIGRKVEETAWNGPSSHDVEEVIVPALRTALQSDDTEILDSAIIALGRISSGELAAAAAADVRSALGSHRTTVRQSAILALGILEHRGSMPVLWEVMNDTAKGRDLLGSSGPVQGVERAFAALALGLVCGPEMALQLRRIVERCEAEDVEVTAGAVLSLGLIPEAASDSVPFLAERLEDETLERRIRAQIPISLARLGEPAAAAVPGLFRLACDRGTDGAVRASCVIALGRLASARDEEVVTGLRKVVQKDSDAQLRHFALIALGQIAAGALSEERRDKEGADAIVRLLSAEIAAPGHGMDLPWAVLAAGIAGNAYAQGAAEVSALVAELMGLFKSTGNPEDAGAMAIALGLLGAPEAGAPLLERFLESNDAALKGHCAVALGLVGHRAAAGALEQALFEHHDARLRVDAATGLGLMGNVEASTRLVEMLAAAPTFAVTGAVAQALGCIADRRAVRQLAALVEDDTQSAAVRGFSCVALGLIAEKTPLPWNAPLSINSNYASELAAQAEVLDIF